MILSERGHGVMNSCRRKTRGVPLLWARSWPGRRWAADTANLPPAARRAARTSPSRSAARTPTASGSPRASSAGYRWCGTTATPRSVRSGLRSPLPFGCTANPERRTSVGLRAMSVLMLRCSVGRSREAGVRSKILWREAPLVPTGSVHYLEEIVYRAFNVQPLYTTY